MTAFKKSKNLSSLIYDFLSYLEVEKGCSPLTLRNYKHYLFRFLKFLGTETDLSSVDLDKIRSYRGYLAKFSDVHGNILSRRTQGYHIIALRSLFKWLTKNDYETVAPEKIDLPKISDRQVKFLTGEQIDRLLSSPSLYGLNGKRDKAILEMLFSTGLRVSELTSLNRDKIDLDRREFGVVGKGGKARVVFLSNRASDWIKNYLNARNDHFKPLFIRHNKGKVDVAVSDEKMRLTPRSIQRIIKKYARKVKLPVEVTPHVMRHSFATDLLMAGADIRSVQEMLGHKNIATTQIYTHVTNKQLKEVHDAFHGKGG
ncbi:MAG: tyrosine recombinase XerC [Candidatus Woesebacteria bacterium]|nr:MAG: tyrosine recombinase XerC [Candidatus Woesebacteria bacterium]